MPMTRGLLLIAAFATTWGLLAVLNIAFWRIINDAHPGIATLAVCLGIGFFAALLLFEILDRTLLQIGKNHPVANRGEEKKPSSIKTDTSFKV